MTTLTSVIAGVDFSAASLSVIRQAAHMARQGGLRVTAVHVLDSSSIAFRTASGAVDEGSGVLEQQARNRLEALILKESLEVEVDIVIRRGRPVDELRNIIEER
jgi:nucleotide-binding universal stress UspA family protein